MQSRKVPVPAVGALLSACLFVSAAQARQPKVVLALDYTQRLVWAFAMNYHAERAVIDGGAASRAATRVWCGMHAKVTVVYKARRLVFSIDTVHVDSDLLTDEERERVVAHLRQAEFSLGLIHGCPVFDTLRTFAVEEIGRWDFVLQFAKLLPDLPEQPVGRHYNWERSGVYPVSTPLGPVPCDIYRLYTIDSVSADSARVHISWDFRYAAAQRAVQQSAALRKVPISGRGTGTAIIDPVRKVLLKATMRFETPAVAYGTKKIQWVENTTLEALDAAQDARSGP
jgi:hypothetical protein